MTLIPDRFKALPPDQQWDSDFGRMQRVTAEMIAVAKIEAHEREQSVLDLLGARACLETGSCRDERHHNGIVGRVTPQMSEASGRRVNDQEDLV
ncbi:hypothetical protein ACFO4E_24630, partial [Nocardiopsis mangrovi]